MFGYIVVNKQELKFREFDEYKAIYCGLCRELRERFGIAGQLTLNYDLTFVILLLTGLYEPRIQKGTTHCIVHPVRKQKIVKNEFTEYAADMNLFLTYYKCKDDWKDERKPERLLYASLLKKGNQQVTDAWPEKTMRIQSWLEEMDAYEKSPERNPDHISGLFGNIMGEILACRCDVWERTLRQMGFYLGKFIYLLDAYEDVEQDAEKGNYNVFAQHWKNPDFDEEMQQILMMMMAECCREFEILPIIKYEEILRNILYSGVWNRYQTVKEKRRAKREKQ